MSINCKWCGLESSTRDACEWCGKELDPDGPVSGPPLDDSDVPEEPFHYVAPLEIRLEWFLGVVLPLFALLMPLAWFSRWAGFGLGQWFWASLFAFIACFFLSVYQLVNSVDEEYAPVGVGLMAQLLLGPIFTFAVFFFFWMVTLREDVQTVALLLLVHLAAATLGAYVARPEINTALQFSGVFWGNAASGLLFLPSVAGWALANFWRPLNE